MRSVAGCDTDPFVAADWGNQDIYFQPRLHYWRRPPVGYAQRSIRLDPAENTGVYIAMGQSNAAAYGEGTLFTPINSAKVDSFSTFNGGMFEGKDPGPNVDGPGTSWMYRLADKLITAGVHQRVIIVPLGMGSAACAYFKPNGPLGRFFPSAHYRLAALGIPITAILWQQGEREGQLGFTQAQYQADLQSVIDHTREVGFSGPWLVGKSTMSGFSTSAAVRAACDAVVNGVDVFAGADTDSLGGANRDAGGTHFSATGVDGAATLWQNAIVAAL